MRCVPRSSGNPTSFYFKVFQILSPTDEWEGIMLNGRKNTLQSTSNFDNWTWEWGWFCVDLWLSLCRQLVQCSNVIFILYNLSLLCQILPLLCQRLPLFCQLLSLLWQTTLARYNLICSWFKSVTHQLPILPLRCFVFCFIFICQLPLRVCRQWSGRPWGGFSAAEKGKTPTKRRSTWSSSMVSSFFLSWLNLFQCWHLLSRSCRSSLHVYVYSSHN